METIVVPAGYTEYPPPPDLANHVTCFWTGFSSSGPATERRPVQRVLPDGSVDILLYFAGDSDTEASAGALELRDVIAVGTMTKPLVVAPGGPCLYVGVRFKPGSAFAAFGIPATELTDEQVSLRLLGDDIDRDLAWISERRSNESRLAALIELVRRRLAGAPVVPRSVRQAVHRILDARGNLRIAALAGDVGITRQQIAKQFATHVGVTPKTLARVMRARAALARADAARSAYPRAIDWSAIAYELGYYDQPHFIDDFKALTGSTPGEWIEGRR